MAKFINFCEEYWKELIILLLTATLGFGLGRLTTKEALRSPIIIEQNSND